MKKILQVLIALTALVTGVAMAVLYYRTPFGSWNNWPFLYQRTWDEIGDLCFVLAISFWCMGFYEWWRRARQHAEENVLLFIAVVPAALFFWSGIGKVIMDVIWCIADGHTCHEREFVGGEIEMTSLSVGLCVIGGVWALVALVRQYALKPDLRKVFGPLLFWWAIPMTLFLIGAFFAYRVAIFLDDCMGVGWKYEFLDASVLEIALLLGWLTLASYWVCWIKTEPGFFKPLFRRPILLLWTLLVSFAIIMINYA